MSIKEKTARLLAEVKDGYISGEEIARRLQVSRAAVWKAVRALKNDGYAIEAVTNRGYRLDGCQDVLSAEKIRDLAKAVPDAKIEVFREVGSTNTVARERAEDGTVEGHTICASAQSSGRGRMGRSFYSPGETGLYMSVVLRPRFAAGEASLITSAAAVAVSRAIERICGIETGIKWVNDIFADGRKVCGILTEASFDMESGGISYAILGIGVNVYAPDGGFPDEISGVAGALLKDKQANLRNRLCAAIIDEFFGIYASLDKRDFLDEYRRRCFVIGQRVGVVPIARAGEDTVTDEAEVIGIDDECSLLLRYSDGSEKVMSSGEIRIKLKQ